MGKPWAGQYMPYTWGPPFQISRAPVLEKPTMLARGRASTMPGMVANVVAKEGTAMVVTVAAGTLTAEEPKFFLANHWQFPGTKTSFFCCVFREITSENPADELGQKT